LARLTIVEGEGVGGAVEKGIENLKKGIENVKDDIGGGEGS
jgi:hypothetical protein